MRFSLSPYKLGEKGPPFTYGGFPLAASDGGCFQDGETEDYFIEGSLLNVCLWEKEVTIDGEGPYAPEDGPFTISVPDTIVITDTLWCNFDYDWDLWESWDESGTHMVSYGVSHGYAAWAVGTFHWWSAPILGNPLVQADKRFYVSGFPALPEPLVITETLDFSPEGIMPTWERPVVLQPHETYVPLALKRY
jgi:hypothetical protein